MSRPNILECSTSLKETMVATVGNKLYFGKILGSPSLVI